MWKCIGLIVPVNNKFLSVSNNDIIFVLSIISTLAIVMAVSLLLKVTFWPEMKTKKPKKQKQTNKQTKNSISNSKQTIANI